MPPARLDTFGVRIGPTGKNQGSARGAAKSVAPRIAPRRRRAPHARPKRLSESQWRGRVAAELDALGLHGAARAWETCGQTVAAPCGACGEEYAVAELHATCGLRACPYCARRNSRSRAERVTRAVRVVPEITERERPDALARLEREAEDSLRLAWVHAFRWEKAYERACKRDHPEVHELAERHKARAWAAEGRRVQAEWHAGRVRDPRWGWRLITIAPQWSPADPREVAPKGLARRVKEVLDRWDDVWAAVSCGGLASAFLSVESSAKGHVHLHALVYSPFVTNRYLSRLAGCFVDVRAVDGERAVREAIKYTVKSVSPLSHRWIGGGKAHVIHPGLAAAWIAATHHVQLGRVVGLVRGLCADDEAADAPDPTPAEPSVRKCRCCDAVVTAALLPVPRDVLARALGCAWAYVLSISRGPAHDGPAADVSRFVARVASSEIRTRVARFAPSKQIALSIVRGAT